MNILEIIAKKRDGGTLTHEEIKFFVDHFTDGLVPDYQASALLMAIYLNSMNDKESADLALCMRDSGDILDLSDVKGIKVDKHSTGGVGDKVSLVLGPLLSYAGLVVAKMSGRGLGHTGGTIDKLEAIPGYQTSLSEEAFKKQLNEIGLAIIGQTGHIAPADKKIYALRDVTETVSCIPLIASSIMSKKLASGADTICLDVKVGSGAFMKNEHEATKLANLMISIGKSQGKNVCAILTDMDTPLGNGIGNSLEVIEAIETLKGNGPKDLVEVTLTIGAQLLVSSKVYNDFQLAYAYLDEILRNGLAIGKLKDMIKYQGGNPNIVDDYSSLVKDAKKFEVKATKSGYINRIDALDIGNAARLLGAGRLTKDDVLLLDVGLIINKKMNDKVEVGDTLVTIYHHDQGLKEAIEDIDKAIVVDDKKIDYKLIKKIIL